MGHGLPEWLDPDWWLAGLQESPIALQFIAVNLCPSLDEPLLRLGQTTTQTLYGVQREHRSVVLIVGMEMRAMVWTTDLDKHPNDDAEESRQFRHGSHRTSASVGR